MLKTSDLRTWLHRDLSSADKLLLVLSTFDSPSQLSDIRQRANEAGFRIPKGWNLSTILSRTKGLAIRTPSGWELNDIGIQHLRNLGVSKLSPAAVQVASDLRSELPKIKNPDTRAFVEEAVKCYEAELYRSAIVMSWLSAVDVLHRQVVSKHLAAFNAEAIRVNSRWKPAVNEDDLGRMQEGEFLDRLAAISVLGKNVKEELKNCLDRRNGCGHPNSLKLGPNTVAHHIEILLLNVFKAFP